MKEQQQKKSFLNAMKSIDSFGEVVNFTTGNDQTKYGSFPGAIFTLLMLAFTLLYGVQKFIVLLEREDTNF